MRADARIAAHRGQVHAVLAQPTEATVAELVAQQAQVRHALDRALAEPAYQVVPEARGPYSVGLPVEVMADFGVRVVGGAVRDRLLGKDQSPDIDCVVPAERWDAFLRYLQTAGHRPRMVPLALGCKLQAGPALGREFVCTRHDSYAVGGKLLRADPTPLQADPWRRDFTLQTLYADPVTGALWDPFGAAKAPYVLRAILPGTLVEDPLRVIRLLRMHITHGLPIDPDTESEARAVAACHWLGSRVERHRSLAEFDRAARAGVLGPVLRLLVQWQWPGVVAAEPSHDGRVARSATQWFRQAGLS